MSAADREPIRVLHVDDDPDFAELTATFLEREREDFEVATAMSATEGLDRLAEGDIDCIVSDYNMPGRNGLEFLEAVREEHPDLPFILFTGKGSEEIASEAITAGVTEYLNKGGGISQYRVLANRIDNAVSQYRAERDLQSSTDRLRQLYGGITDAIFVLDADWQFVHLNDRAEAIFERTEAEVICENVWDQFPKAVDTTFQEQYEKAMHQRVAVEFEAFYPPLDIWVEVRAIPIDDGLTVHFRDISEKKEREREFEERATAMAASMDGMAILDADGEYTYVNDAHADVYGYDDPDAFLGEHWRMCYTDDDLPFFEREVMPALERDDQWRGEATGKRRDGSRFSQELTLTALEGGGLVCVVRDITERKERRHDLERSEALLEKTQQLATVGGWELDLRADELRWTDEVRRIHDLPLDYEPALDDAIDFYHPEDAPIIEDAVERAIDGGESFDLECRLITADDDLRWVRARGEPRREDGETVVVRGAFQDITERKEREQELETYTSMVNSVPDLVYRLDTDGRYIAVNDTAKAVTGYNPEELRGEHVSRIMDEADIATGEAVIRDLLKDDDSERATFEMDIVAADGERAPFECHISLVRTQEGSFDGTVGIVRDITERKRHEQRLEALHEGTRAMMNAETPAEVGKLAVETAHDALELPLTGCWLYDPDDVCLRPTAFTDEAHAVFDEFPTYTSDNSLSWDVFTTGEPAIYDDLSVHPEAYDPESPIASEIIVPVGDYGVLNSGSTDPESFDDIDASTAQILGANTEAALERADRETLLREREAQLERERDRFARLFERIPDPSVVVEIPEDDAITQSVNAAFEDVFGYAGEDVVGQSLNELIVPPDRMDEAREIDRTVVGGEDIVREVRRRTAAGEVRDFLFRNVSIDQGDEYEAFGIYTDITERRRAEEYRRRLYDVVSDAELTTDERVRRLLDLGSERLGMEIGYLTRVEGDTQRIVEACGSHEKLQPGEECPLARAYCRKTIEADTPLTLQHAAEAGWSEDPAYEEFGLEAYVGSKLTIDGELYGTVCFADRAPRETDFSAVELAFVDLVTRGITSELERRRYERELEEQRRKIESLHAVATNLVTCKTESEIYELTVDAAERIIDLDLCYVGIVEGESIVPEARSSRAGPEHVRTMGVEEGLAGKTFQTGASYLIADLIESEAAEPTQADYRSAISSPISDVGVFQAVSTEEGRFDEDDLELVEILLAHVSATLDRVKRETDLERQQQELQRQNDRLEEFASVLSHDLRNPLSVAEGYLEFVPEEGNEEFLEKIHNAHDRIERIIEDVLTLARQGQSIGETSTVELASIAEQAWNNVDTGKVALVIEGGGEDTEALGTIEADEGRLEQIFENLFRNAIEHGGRDVTVRVGCSASGFYVEDDGPGIPADEREQVFEHGHTTSDSGTGFGLSIVAQITEAHGWEITASEGTDGGARFEINV